MLRRGLTVAVALLSAVVSAQEYIERWKDVTASSISSESLAWRHVRIAGNDNILVGGQAGSRFVAKGYTPDGAERWFIRDETLSTDNFKLIEIETDLDGNLYSLVSTGNGDVHVTAYAAATGAFRWRRSVSVGTQTGFDDPLLDVAKRGSSTFIYLTVAITSDSIVAHRLNPATGQITAARSLSGRSRAADIDGNGNYLFSNDRIYQKFSQSLNPVWETDGNFLITSRSIRVHPQTGQVVASNTDSLSFDIFGQLTEINPLTGVRTGQRTYKLAEDFVGSGRSTLLPRPGGAWLAKDAKAVTGFDANFKIDQPSRQLNAENVVVDASGQTHAAVRSNFTLTSYPRGEIFQPKFDTQGSTQEAFDVAVDSQNRVVVVGSALGLTQGGIVQVEQPFLTGTDVFAEQFVDRLEVIAPGVLGNDSNANGATVSLSTPPTLGSVTLRQDGGFTYVPGASFEGSDQFRYRLQKGAIARIATVFVRRVTATELRLVAPAVVGGDPYLATIILSTGAFIDPINLRVDSTSSIAGPAFSVAEPGQTSILMRGQTQVVNATQATTLSTLISNRTVTASLGILPGGLSDIISVGNAPVVRGQTSRFRLVLSGILLSSRQFTIRASGSNSSPIVVPAGSSTVDFDLPVPATGFFVVASEILVNGRRLSLERIFTPVAVPILAGIRIVDTPLYAGTPNNVEVTLDSPSGFTPNVVQLSSNNPKVTIGSTASVVTNQTTARRSISPPAATANQTVSFTATLNGTSQVVTSLIRPNLLQSLTISPNVVRAGVSTTGTVQLSWLAPSGGQTVQMKSDRPTVGIVSSTVFVAEGLTNRSFQIRTKGPLVVTTPVVITAKIGSVVKSQAFAVTP